MRCRYLAYGPPGATATSSFVLQENQEWFIILVLAYPGCQKGCEMSVVIIQFLRNTILLIFPTTTMAVTCQQCSLRLRTIVYIAQWWYVLGYLSASTAVVRLYQHARSTTKEDSCLSISEFGLYGETLNHWILQFLIWGDIVTKSEESSHTWRLLGTRTGNDCCMLCENRCGRKQVKALLFWAVCNWFLIKLR